MTTALLLRPTRVTPRRTARAAARSRRPAVLLAGLALLTVAGTGAAGVVLQQGSPPAVPTQAPVGATVPVGGLELTVTRFERRADAMTGTGTAKQPMSGPAMPMNDPAGMAGTAGMAGMAGMPGMAGMLEHGQERVDVSVVVRGSAGRPVRVDPDRFRLYSGGVPVELLQPNVSTLSRTALPQGSAMRGGVVLVVPEGTRPLELAYGDEPARILLDAGPAAGGAVGGPHGAAHAEDGR